MPFYFVEEIGFWYAHNEDTEKLHTVSPRTNNKRQVATEIHPYCRFIAMLAIYTSYLTIVTSIKCYPVRRFFKVEIRY